MAKVKDRKETVSTKKGMNEKIVEEYPALEILVKEYLVPGIWLKIKEEYRQYFEMRDKLKKMIVGHELDNETVLKKVRDLEWEVRQLKEGIGKRLIDSCKK